MRKIEEVLRLRLGAKLGIRQVAAAVGVGKATVSDYVARAEAQGLSWPLPAGMDGAELERRLFPATTVRRMASREQPDWAAVHRELRRPGVTLQLLWQEYIERHPQGYSYTRFCELYGAYKGRLDVVMRQTHRAGEKLFVDYAGQRSGVVDADTGEVCAAEIFVAVLGASNYTYAEATWTQALPDWIGAHVRALEFFGGAPEILVPDNLKSAVSKAHRYEPDLNPTYQDFARYYGVAVVPARVRRPRDKAKAEAGVLLVERWILARLRHQTFFSLTALNAAIATLLDDLNERPFKKLDGSRRSHFDAIDRPALRALPASAYEYAEWRKARVAPNIHIEVDGHYYSVPHTLVKRQLDVRLTARIVEVFHQHQRIASHQRGAKKGGYTTLKEHMPERHQRSLDWTPERLIAWGRKSGPATGAVIEHLLGARAHPQQSFNACFGVMRLGQAYGQARLEAACQRALLTGALRYKSLESILKNGLDQQPVSTPDTVAEPIAHANVRGSRYYH